MKRGMTCTRRGCDTGRGNAAAARSVVEAHPHTQETAMTDIHDARILILATDGFEQSELEKPLSKLREAGATVTVASPDKTMSPGKIRGWDHTDWGRDVPVDKKLGEVDPMQYDALVLPGGQMNPDKLRMEPQ